MSCSGERKPSGRSRTPRNTLNTAVLPPIAIASTSAPALVKPGARQSDRSANRTLPTLLREAKPMPVQEPENTPVLVLGLRGTVRIRDQSSPDRSRCAARTRPLCRIGGSESAIRSSGIDSRWIDQPLPALRGATPLQAVRTSRGRKQVELLLKELENGESRLPQGERFYVSVLRSRLGLPRGAGASG